MLPSHSFLRGVAREGLWRDNDACRVGQGTAPAPQILGTDDLRQHCPFCAILNAEAPPVPPR